MELVTRIITIVGAGAVIMGLVWAFSGVYTYFKGRKNKNNQDMDEGLEGIINGGILAAISGGIAAAIVTAINSITF